MAHGAPLGHQRRVIRADGPSSTWHLPGEVHWWPRINSRRRTSSRVTMALPKSGKRVAFEDGQSSSTKRRRISSTSGTPAANKRDPKQSTLTQIDFVPRPSNSFSEEDLEYESLGLTDLPGPRRTSSTKVSDKKRQPCSFKKQTSTLTQMDFLSSSFGTAGADHEDMAPIRVHKCTKKRKASVEDVPGAPPVAMSESQHYGCHKETRPPKPSSKRSSNGKRSERPSTRDAVTVKEPAVSSRLRRRQSPAPPTQGLEEVSETISETDQRGQQAQGLKNQTPAIVQRMREVEDSQDPGIMDDGDPPSSSLAPLPRTPITKRHIIIPSSQSPESLPPSTSRKLFSQKSLYSPRSPLKERSANIITPSRNRQIKTATPSTKKRICERNKSNIVVLPIALTSQGAVSRGGILTKSQWPQMHSRPPNTSTRTSRILRDVIPASQDDDDEASSVEDLPSLAALIGRRRSVPASPELASTQMDGLEIQGDKTEEQVSISSPRGSNTPVRRKDSIASDAESLFSPGPPIWTSSQPGPDKSTAAVISDPPVSPSPASEHESEAAAAQLHSDMLHHSTQIAANDNIHSSETNDKEATQSASSQISTQSPTQLRSRVFPVTSQAGPGKTPERVYIKLKSSSSMAIPLDGIPRYSQIHGYSQTRYDEHNFDEDDDDMETDDLNGPTYASQSTRFLQEARRLSPHAENTENPYTFNDEGNTSKPADPQSEKRTGPPPSSISTYPPSPVIQPPTSETELPSSSSLPTPRPPLTVNSNPASQHQHQPQPFSSSPITKDVHWTLSDSLLESLPGPPEGWDGYHLFGGQGEEEGGGLARI